MDIKQEILATIEHVLRRRAVLQKFVDLGVPRHIIDRQTELVEQAERRWDAAAKL